MIKLLFKYFSKLKEYISLDSKQDDKPAGSYVNFSFLPNEKVLITYSDRATIETFELICRTNMLNMLVREKIGMSPLDQPNIQSDNLNFLPSSFHETGE